MLLAMRRMCIISYFMSESSSELSEAMIEYGRVFEERARDDPTRSTNQLEDNARFRCYSHASKFWSEMSTMQMAVHETLLRDYKHLNRQGARFFGLHASHDANDRLLGEYNKMLNRVERVAGFHLPADLKDVESKVSEDAHLNPGYRKHARSKSEYSSRPRHVHSPPRACPVSGFTHEQVPHSLETPAIYPGLFRHRWGELDIGASQILREASSGDERFKALFEMRDKLMMSFAEKHNDALRDLETDFLTRVAVGLTNTSFDRLRDAHRKADEWASVVGLRTYANQLNLSPPKAQAKLDEPLEPSPDWPVVGSAFMNDEFQPDYQWDFSVDGSANTTTNPEIGRTLSPGPLPEDLIEERAENEDDESESDDSTSDDSTSPEDSEPGPNAPGHNNPQPPGGNSGSNSAGGASAGGRSNSSARGSGGRASSANNNSFYSGSGNSYEGNRRPFEGLQASLLKQMIYELSNNESPSINSDSPSGSNCNSVGSPSTTQTSIGSIGDLFKSPEGSPSGRYTLTMTQPVPEVAATSVSPGTGAAEVALGKKGGKQKLSDATFGIVEISMGSKIVHGLAPRVAQAQNPSVNPFKDTPTFSLLEDLDEDSVDDHKVIRPRRKHRHLRRVPRFVTLQGGKLQVFGRHNSYTGTGLKTKFPARDQPLLRGYQRLNSSSSLPILPDCDAVAKSADPLSDLGSTGSTAFEPGNDLFYQNASGQTAGTIPQ